MLELRRDTESQLFCPCDDVTVKASSEDAEWLMQKRALLDCIATALELDIVEVSLLLPSLRVHALEFYFRVLIQLILTTAGILDAAAILMKRPSSSEQVRGGIC